MVSPALRLKSNKRFTVYGITQHPCPWRSRFDRLANRLSRRPCAYAFDKPNDSGPMVVQQDSGVLQQASILLQQKSLPRLCGSNSERRTGGAWRARAILVGPGAAR